MDIHSSVDKILSSDRVLGEEFYERFFEHEEVQHYFATANLQRQAVLLTMALLVIEQCADGGAPIVDQYLRDLGRRHAEWGIPGDLYPNFRVALLETLEDRHGDDWSEELRDQWSAAIELAARRMLEGYPSSMSGGEPDAQLPMP